MRKKIEEAKPEPVKATLEPEPVKAKEEDTAPEKRASKNAKANKWRVTKEALANVNGSFTRLVEGQTLDPLGYSDQVIESLRSQGVQLEPV